VSRPARWIKPRPTPVKSYQKQNGLKADGIVGQQTWGKLAGLDLKPGVDLLKPWAKSFLHRSDGFSGTPASGQALKDKALAMHGPAFMEKLNQVAQRLGVKPEQMLKVMNNESGLKPGIQNSIGAPV